MRGIEPDRRQQRPHLPREVVGGPRPLGARELGPADEPHARRRQRRQHLLVQHPVLPRDQRPRLVAHPRDEVARLGQRHAGRRDLRAELLLDARDADLEELVQVAADDAQEAQPLEQRHLGVLGQREHAPVEVEQRKLAVDGRGDGRGHDVGRGLGPRREVRGRAAGGRLHHGGRRTTHAAVRWTRGSDALAASGSSTHGVLQAIRPWDGRRPSTTRTLALRARSFALGTARRAHAAAARATTGSCPSSRGRAPRGRRRAPRAPRRTARAPPAAAATLRDARAQRCDAGPAGAHVDRQRLLSARHREIDLGQQLRVEQRAVQRAVRVGHAEALAQRVQVVALAGKRLARERQRVDQAAVDVLAQRELAQRELAVEERDVERRVVDDPLRAARELDDLAPRARGISARP